MDEELNEWVEANGVLVTLRGYFRATDGGVVWRAEAEVETEDAADSWRTDRVASGSALSATGALAEMLGSGVNVNVQPQG